MKKLVSAADLFCGTGGTSAGMLQACKSLGFELNLVAVNHCPLAIQTQQQMADTGSQCSPEQWKDPAFVSSGESCF